MQGAELYGTFQARAEAANAEIHRFATLGDAVSFLSELLCELDVGDDPGCAALWAAGPLVRWLAERGRALARRGLAYEVTPARAAEARVGISEADFAIADTGTLVQDVTDVAQRLVSTLPEIHVAFVTTARIVPDLGAALTRLELGTPSYWALVTGPSRTADIERVLTIGAHGPRRLIVLCCDEELA